MKKEAGKVKRKEERKRKKKETKKKQHKSSIELGPLPSASFFRRAMWPIAFPSHVRKAYLNFTSRLWPCSFGNFIQ
jgi:hypothetical protein